MPQQAAISVRRLPGGELHPALAIASQGRSWVVEFGDGGAPSDLTPASPVEIITAQTTYLGEVLSCQPQRIEVQVEHAVDRSRVAALQAAWDQSGSAR